MIQLVELWLAFTRWRGVQLHEATVGQDRPTIHRATVWGNLPASGEVNSTDTAAIYL